MILDDFQELVLVSLLGPQQQQPTSQEEQAVLLACLAILQQLASPTKSAK